MNDEMWDRFWDKHSCSFWNEFLAVFAIDILGIGTWDYFFKTGKWWRR